MIITSVIGMTLCIRANGNGIMAVYYLANSNCSLGMDDT